MRGGYQPSIYQWGGFLPWGGFPLGGFHRGAVFGRGRISSKIRPGGGLRGRGRGRRQGRPAKPATAFPMKCDLCKVSLLDKEQLDAHYNGRRHLRNLKEAMLLKKIRKENGASPYIVGNPNEWKRRCTLCNVEIHGAEKEDLHLKGAKHQNKIKRIQLGETVVKQPSKLKFGRCEVCDKPYNSLVMKEDHLNGKKHRAKCRKRGLPVRPVKRRAADITSDANLAAALPCQNNKILSKPQKKMQKLQPKKMEKREPIALQVPAYQVLEKQTEDAWKKYAETTLLDPSSGPRLYIEYQNIYRAYEASYDRYVRAANVNALAGVR